MDKRDGSTEAFDGDKLLRALLRVSRHRGLKDEVLRRVARDIEAEMVDSGRRSVAWTDLARAALRRLEAIDRLSAQRLAANYLDETGTLRLGGDQDPGTIDLFQLGLPGVADE